MSIPTRVIGESASVAVNDTVVLPAFARTPPTLMTGGVWSIWNAELSRSPDSAMSAGFDGRSEATTRTK